MSFSSVLKDSSSIHLSQFKVSPVGNFVNNAHAFAYFRTPKYGVYTKDGEVLSSDHCMKYGSHYVCSSSQSKCTIANYKNCMKVLKITPNGVFTFEMGDATYIATTETVRKSIEMATLSFLKSLILALQVVLKRVQYSCVQRCTPLGPFLVSRTCRFLYRAEHRSCYTN